jgi:hypothetical protein
MKVQDDSGVSVDASFSVRLESGCAVISFECRGFGRNTEYGRGLDILLERLSVAGATVEDAYVASRKVAHLGRSDTTLASKEYPLPMRLERGADVVGIRWAWGRRMAGVGRVAGSPRGGNPTKRIEVVARCGTWDGLSGKKIEELLAWPDKQATRAELEEAARVPEFGDELDVEQRALGRKEQSYLRSQLLGATEFNRCGVCGRMVPNDLLVAAHIKRRAACSYDERLDHKYVVMLMCRLGCDSLFEQGYIGVEGGKIVAIGEKALESAVAELVGQLAGKRCASWSEATRGYFEWHLTYARSKVSTPGSRRR